jgi:hypothetical protein
MPGDVSLHTELIRLTHVGYPGIEKTVKLLQRNYCWLSL